MTISIEKLLVLSMVTSIVSMLLSCAALWPHSQDGLRKFRDGVLWFAFIFVLVGALTAGWRLLERRQATGWPSTSNLPVSKQAAVSDHSSHPTVKNSQPISFSTGTGQPREQGGSRVIPFNGKP